MSLDTDIALIRSVPFLSVLGEEEARLVAFGAERRRMGAGERLMREGSYSDGAYIITAGAISITTKTGRREVMGPGTIVSPLALVSEIEHPQTALAAEPSEVLKVSRPLFRRVMEEYPEVARRLHERITEQLAALSPELQRILDELNADGEPEAETEEDA